MLNQEEKVHEVLDHVYSQKTTGSAISFPRFLPPKVLFCLFLLHLCTVHIEIMKTHALYFLKAPYEK